MQFALRSMSVMKRQVLVLVTVQLGILLLSAVALHSYRSQLETGHREAVQSLGEIGRGVIAHFHALEESGRMTRNEAQEAAKAAVRELRYKGSEYFWINDTRSVMVMHPARPELEGQDLSNNQDPNGKYVFREFVEVAKRDGAGIVEYMWPKPGYEEPQPKISFVAMYEPWNWVIGTGVYVDDIDQAFLTHLSDQAIIQLLLMAALLVLAWRVARSITIQLGGEPEYAARVARRIAAGELDEKVDVREGDAGSLLAALSAAQESVHQMAVDTRKLVDAAAAGELATRADAARHEGEYREIVEGVNATLDAVIGPLNVAAGYVDRISNGDIPEKITDEYKGDFNALKNNLNTCIDAVNRLVKDANMLSEAALAGELATRADAKRHEGDFRKIVEGVNATLDAVVVPVNEVKRVMVALSEGDLTQKIQGNYQGDFKVLQEAVDDSIDKLNELITGIKGSADAINTAAKEIAAGNTNLSQRTEEQASSLEETASSMEELTSTVKQNADNARQANQLAHGASDVASKGGDKVREVVVTMGAITESSKKIADIIQVIDGIAFQTNILALNAAVEAARAGEQGRGFAVVAGEVRTLAQRSAAAAKEIKTLINDSVDTVEGGSKLVEQAGATMEEIVSAVKRVTDIMAEISAASDEQSQGIEQVSTAVSQMDEVTQQNAALVEESAAAASSLEDQAHGLAQAVSVFRIDDAKPSGIAAPRSMAARAGAPTARSNGAGQADGGGAKATGSMPRTTATVRAPKPTAVADAGEEWAEF